MKKKKKFKITRPIIFIFALVGVILWSAVAVSPGKTLDVNFLNVGQGDAIYASLPTGEDFLIDGGPDNAVLSQLGEVMPFYDRQINLVIATHNHADHIKGLIEVLNRFEVKEIWISGAVNTTQTYLQFLEAVNKEKQQGASVKTVRSGDQIELGSATIKVLFPVENVDGDSFNDQHDATVVTRLTYGLVDFLFTGDLKENHEQEILNSQFSILNSEVLKIPHHGSASGLLDAFLDAVKPKYAVIQVGANNKFGHPTPSVLKKLEDRVIPYYRTDKNGRVEIATDGEHIFVKSQR